MKERFSYEDHRARMVQIRERNLARRAERQIGLIQKVLEKSGYPVTLRKGFSPSENYVVPVSQDILEEIQHDIKTRPESVMVKGLKRINEKCKEEGVTIKSWETLAEAVNEQIGRHLPDDFKINNLHLRNSFARYGLDHMPGVGRIFTRAMNCLVRSRKFSGSTVGDLRETSSDELECLNNLGKKGTSFLKIAFERAPQEPH